MTCKHFRIIYYKYLEIYIWKETIKMNNEQIEEKHHDLALTYKDYQNMQCDLLNSKIDKYYISQQIGEGASAKIYKGINQRTKTQVSIKVLDLRKISLQTNPKAKKIRRRLAQDQSKIMMKFDCPNLLKCYECFQNRDLKIMVTQFCNQGSLQQKIDSQIRIPEDEAVSILKQIINGIGQCHRQKIIHRDLKADNILLHNGQCKIADFGFSKLLKITNENDLSTNTVLGTMLTMAPQVMNKQPYGLKADIWSIGVIFFQMIFGQCPFKSNTSAPMIVQIMNYNFSTIQEYKGVRPSQKAKDFLKQVLVVDIKKRLGWKEVSQHEIFRVQQDTNLPGVFHRNASIIVADTQLIQIERQFIMNSQVTSQSQSIAFSGLMQLQDSSKKPSQNESQTVIKQIVHQEKSDQRACKPSHEHEQLLTKYNNLPRQEKVKLEKQNSLKKPQCLYQKKREQKVTQSKKYTHLRQAKSGHLQKQNISQEQLNFNCKKVNPSQMDQIKGQVNKQEENTYLWAQKIHLECLKTQCILNNVIKVIDNQKLINLTDRKSIQMMYLICTRCLNNISPINFQYEKRKSNIIVKELHDLVSRLYSQVTQKWLKYSKYLTDKQDQKYVVFKDWFSKILNKNDFKQKDRFLTGIQSMTQFRPEGSEDKKTIQKRHSKTRQNDLLDYDKDQQIDYTNKCIQQNINNYKFCLKRKQVRNYMKHFKDICEIQVKDLKDTNFKQYVQSLLLESRSFNKNKFIQLFQKH